MNPDCRKCKKKSVLADAGLFKTISYFYCRNCKIEIDKWGYEVTPKKTESIQELEDCLVETLEKLGDYELFGEIDLNGEIFTEEQLEEFSRTFLPKSLRKKSDDDYIPIPGQYPIF